MAAVPLFRDTKMAAVTSRENTIVSEWILGPTVPTNPSPVQVIDEAADSNGIFTLMIRWEARFSSPSTLNYLLWSIIPTLFRIKQTLSMSFICCL